MKPLVIINDCHLGVKRVSGTTKESMAALQEFQIREFKSLVNLADNADLLINGDLFDKFEVDKLVEFQVFSVLSTWLIQYPDQTLYLSAGNHDLSTNSERTSSFENLCNYLESFYDNVKTIRGNNKLITDNWAVVAHHANQNMFEEALDELLQEDNLKYVFVHANLMSPFAEHSDHSLNVSEEILNRFAEKGVTVVFAHEHNRRQLLNAVVIGNQIPSSISDCLDPNPTKQVGILKESGLEFKDWCSISSIYAEVDWRSESFPDVMFLRLSGTADYEQAAEVVQTAVNVRQTSRAFVVSNNVKVNQIEETAESAEQLSEFNVQALVLEELPTNLKHRFNEVLDMVNQIKRK